MRRRGRKWVSGLVSGRDASVRSHKSWQFAHVYVSRGRRKAETQKKSAPASQSPASRQRFCPCSLFFSTHSGKYTMQRCSDERLDAPATSIVCTVRSTRSSPRVRSVWFFGFGFLGFWVFGFWVFALCVSFFLACVRSFVRSFVHFFLVLRRERCTLGIRQQVSLFENSKQKSPLYYVQTCVLSTEYSSTVNIALSQIQ